MPESQRAQRIGIVCLPFHPLWDTGKYDAVSPVSRHAKQPCPLHCSHVMPGTGIFSKARWLPGLHLGMEAQAGGILKSSQICLRIMPMPGCRAGLLFRRPGVSGLLCPPFVSHCRGRPGAACHLHLSVLHEPLCFESFRLGPLKLKTHYSRSSKISDYRALMPKANF